MKIKNNKKQVVKGSVEKKEESNILIPSIILLVIMVFSMFGFALSGSGSSSSSTSGGSDVAFGQNFQNPETGELYYGTVKNGEQFVFYTIEDYDLDIVESGIARRLKEHSFVNLYIDSEFDSSNARYLIEKSLRANGIVYNQVFERECYENTLVLTTNTSYEGDLCIKFIASNEEAENKANILSYHLVK